jgi:hypothetical protein
MAAKSSSGGCRFDKDTVDFLSIEVQSGGGVKRCGATVVLRRGAAAVGFQVPRNESNIRLHQGKMVSMGGIKVFKAT